MDNYYKNIKQLIEKNLIEVKKQEMSVNYHTLLTYFNIGKILIDAQGGKKRAKYGNGIIKEYASKLSEEYGKKFSERNLRSMRQFYLTFRIWNSVNSKLTWTHYKIILSFEQESKRNYYINSIIDYNFSVRQLIEYIKSNAYERLVNKENIKIKHLKKDEHRYNNILDMIKNPILITINKSVDKITERALKSFMLEQIEKTMLELGTGFAYVGSEVPIRIDNKILRPDLVFFNTEMVCYVILELKLKELTIKDIGQIEFYIKYYDINVKKPFFNPTIGITISKKINKDMINYNCKENIKHSTYELIEKHKDFDN